MSTSSTVVSFPASGDHCVGDLHIPDTDHPVPVVILASGLGGVRAVGLGPFAQRFTQAGWASLSFDYRHFGDSGGQPRQLLSIHRQRQDWAGAIAYVKNHPLLRSDRIVLWGTSFAGGHVLDLASRRDDLAGVIAQCPFTDGLASALALAPLSSLKVGMRAIADAIAVTLRREPVLVDAAGPPRSAALMTAADALPGYYRLIDNAGRDIDTRVSARIALTLPFDRPGRQLAKIRIPSLIQVCHPDTVAPDRATMRHLHRASNPAIRVEHINHGHFDIYDGAPFERVVSSQVAYLTELTTLTP